MAVFSNDPRAQALWKREQMLNLITSSPCPDTREQRTDICRGDDEKRRRLGYAGCTKVEIVKNDCQDYNRNVKAKAETSAELAKYLKDTAKAKADKDRKEKETAAEQAILARRRAADKTLETSYLSACRQYTLNEAGFSKPGNPNYDPKKCAELDKERIKGGGAFQSGQNPVTFDEVARELATSKASGKAVKKPAKLKAKAKAKAKAAAKLKKRNR